MTVEITPSGSAAVTARQLLDIAETDPRFRIEDVKTTTDGPMGLAFLVPDDLYEVWDKQLNPTVTEEILGDVAEEEVSAAPRRGRRPRGTDTGRGE